MTLEKWHCGVPCFSFSGTSRSNLLSWQVNQCFPNCQHFSSAWELKIKLWYFFLLFHCSWCQPSKSSWHYCLRSASRDPAPSPTAEGLCSAISRELIADAGPGCLERAAPQHWSVEPRWVFWSYFISLALPIFKQGNNAQFCVGLVPAGCI